MAMEALKARLTDTDGVVKRMAVDDRKKNMTLHEKGNSKLPWREAGQPCHLVDVVDSGQ